MDKRANEIKWEVNSNGCHICISHAPYKNGYHYIKRDGKRHALHRFVYEEHHGQITEGLVVRHKCDNKSCINPDHLETGSQSENIQDMMERGRHKVKPQIGEENHASTLTEDDIREIRADKSTSNTDLARKYGVSDVNIYYIRKRITWKHVI